MKNFLKTWALLGVAAAGLFAQAPAAAPAAGPSPDEIKDAQAIQQKQVATAADADAKMTMVNQFVAKYPTSTIKGYILTMGGEAAQAKRDTARAQYYYQQAIAADPTSDYAMIMLGAEIAQNTGEHDLDKKDKLARAEKLAKDAMGLIEKRAKQPQEDQAQFDQEKAQDMARAHMTLGLVAMADQKDEAAGKEFLQAANGDAMNLLRAGMAFNNAKKIDDANAALDKFISIPGLPDQYKKMAEDEKKRGAQIKAGK
jgi:tetratricopeptide (TPR) repeat protein